jgi:hypothetical protein
MPHREGGGGKGVQVTQKQIFCHPYLVSCIGWNRNQKNEKTLKQFVQTINWLTPLLTLPNTLKTLWASSSYSVMGSI